MDEILLRDLLNETSPAVPSNGPNCFSLLYKWIAEFLLLGTAAKIERKCVTSCYHGSKISGSQSSFLTETAIFIVERWKKRMHYRFHPECNQAQESHTHQLFVFSMSHLQDHGLLRSRNFVTMVTWQRDVTTSPLY